MLRLRVQPRASRDEIVGWQAGVLRLRVTAPPVEGEANRAVAALLARVLGVAPSRIHVVRGARGREKLVEIVGLGGDHVRSRLASLSAHPGPTPGSRTPLQ
ncbi:MAG: DUF167 domain-containing protein [Candidatus Rokubacteria bacterium]|nr:DUF167 domain-containing protein [Candidatus Rokubacteria bacterium]